MVKADSDDVIWTTLSVTALNDAFLKVRYTVPIDEMTAPRINSDMLRFNTDVASFCCHFAPEITSQQSQMHHS